MPSARGSFIYNSHKPPTFEIKLKNNTIIITRKDDTATVIISTFSAIIKLVQLFDDKEYVFLCRGKKVFIKKDSYPELLYRDWISFCITEERTEIGPYPEIFPFQQIVDKESEENKEKIKKKTPLLEKIFVKNREVWNQLCVHTHKEYNEIIISFAKRWAALMQIQVCKGEKVIHIWEKTAQEADSNNMIPIAMKEKAREILVFLWLLGEELEQVRFK